MRFAVLAWDAPDSADARRITRDAHFAHIEMIVDQIAVSGPLKNAEGTNTGSLLILDVESAAAADALIQSDPYFAAGVWLRYEVHGFQPMAGEWVGGTIW